jgi:hypothetical protein
MPVTIMRTAAAVVLLAATVALGADPAAAGPTPTPTPAQAGTTLCQVTDERATELSGLVATPTGYVAINDGNDDSARTMVFYLDQRCRVTRTLSYPTPARDPEDVAQAPDGTFWVSDTGDNINSPTHRSTVALWHVPADGRPPVIYRLTYPDGEHDAEALFFTPNGIPVIVTKEVLGVAGLYEPARTLEPQTTAGVPLKKVGTFTPTPTGVPNLLGRLGEILVTGAATSPDRHLVALRTYGAAYEWDVPDGDPVKAITTTAPRVTPLPNEPQGESIAYTLDGRFFLTVSDESGPTKLQRYERSTQVAIAPMVSPSGAAAQPTSQPAVARALTGIPGWAMISVAGVGLLLAAAGLVGLLRSRRRAEHRA